MDFAQQLEESIAKKDPFIRLWAGEDPVVKTDWIVDRAVNLAIEGLDTLIISPNKGSKNALFTMIQNKISEKDFSAQLSFTNRNEIYLRETPGVITLIVPEEVKKQVENIDMKYRELLIDDDHLIKDKEWKTITDNASKLAEHVISLSGQ